MLVDMAHGKEYGHGGEPGGKEQIPGLPSQPNLRQVQADGAQPAQDTGQHEGAQPQGAGAGCSLLALPSAQETAPMVIAQAMAAGKPVVAARVPPAPGRFFRDG